jgi:hypothetical protein
MTDITYTVLNDVKKKFHDNGDGTFSETVMSLDSFGIAGFDDVELSYTGANMTGVTYRKGGPTGTIVAVMALAYDGNGELTRVTRTQ